MYVLILMYTLGGIGGGISLTAVPGYGTLIECNNAGIAWHKTEKEADRNWECLPGPTR